MFSSHDYYFIMMNTLSHMANGNFIYDDTGVFYAGPVPGLAVTATNGKYQISYSIISETDSGASVSSYDGKDNLDINLRNNLAHGTDYIGAISTALEAIFSEQGQDSYGGLFQDVANLSFVASSVNTFGVISVFQVTDGYSNFSGTGKTTSAFARTWVPSSLTPPSEVILQVVNDIYINISQSSGDSGYNTWKVGGANGGNYILPGTKPFTVLLEEIGHTLGIDVMKMVNGVTVPKDSSIATHKYSVTAYKNHPDMYFQNQSILEGFDRVEPPLGPFPLGLQLYDIAALQAIYGRNYTTRATDTVYDKEGAFKSTAFGQAFVYTIWDGGGIDTIDASGYGTPAQIDLRQGRFSSIGNTGLFLDNVNFDTVDYDAGNLAIAYYAVIENAIGTNAPVLGTADILIGNAWNNKLEGGAGDDILYGDGIVYDGNVGFLGQDPGQPPFWSPPPIGTFPPDRMASATGASA